MLHAACTNSSSLKILVSNGDGVKYFQRSTIKNSRNDNHFKKLLRCFIKTVNILGIISQAAAEKITLLVGIARES